MKALANNRQSSGALCLILGLALAPIHSASAQGNPLNGSSPRPFYIVAHNPNTLVDVQVALDNGANALEPDVTLVRCNTGNPLDDLVAWDSSAPNRDGCCSDTKLIDWLKRVHDLAIGNVPLALIVFDIKSSAATPEIGSLILNAIRTHLNFEGVDLNVILSVGTKDDLAVFEKVIASPLRQREGVMVDGEDDAAAVVNYFFAIGYRGNIAYGDGTAGGGGSLPRAIGGAVGNRAATGYPRTVAYVYSIEHITTMNQFIDAGVDGIIPDRFPPPKDLDGQYIARLKNVVAARKDVRLATRLDNPFVPNNEAYALQIRTANDATLGGEGTNADLMFTIEGALGKASVTVNTGFLNPLLNSHRMEAGETDWVTIASKNLGVLKSITIHNGGGLAADWKLLDINVYSAKWVNPLNAYRYTATFDDWINANTFRTLALKLQAPPPHKMPDEYVWAATDHAYSDGAVAAPWTQVIDAYNFVSPGGTIHVATGVYGGKLILTKPCRLEFWPEQGSDPPSIGER